MMTKRDCSIAILLAWIPFQGCAEAAGVLRSTWHEKCGWKAEDYFDDPQVIALCRAIQANDITEIDRVVAAGANVNAQGKGKMTLLLWAYPDNNLNRFTRLLEHGANPNVTFESDFNTRGGISAGDSVTHMACGTAFPGYFDAVFAHGGDPNLVKTTRIASKQTPLFTLIKGRAREKARKVEQLIDKGADLNYMDGSGLNPAMTAVGWGGQYDLALMLLIAGADYRVYQANQIQRLIHVVAREESRLSYCTQQQQDDYQALVKWLANHGEFLEVALADIKRWDSWSRTTGEYRRKMDAEIAERKAREAREKVFAENLDQAQD